MISFVTPHSLTSAAETEREREERERERERERESKRSGANTYTSGLYNKKLRIQQNVGALFGVYSLVTD